jgi:hypothetical protein
MAAKKRTQTSKASKGKTSKVKPKAASAGAKPKSSQTGKAKTEAGNKTRGKKSGRTSGKTKGAKSEGIATEAIRIVEQAASILEEEIAAGIVAARKVEQHFVNVNALRSGSSDQVMQRFRTDAHEILDILLDLVNLSINALTGMGERAISMRGSAVSKDKSGTAAEEGVAEVVIADTLKPGASGKAGMLVENEGDTPTGKIRFITAGLINSDGDWLEPASISFEPPELEIAANDLEKVTVHVAVPAKTPAGQYSGLVYAPAIQMRALLTVNVAA